MQRAEKWADIYEQYSNADRDRALEPHELEKLALAAYLTGRDTESFDIFERAHQAYLENENPQNAVRCAFWLGLILMNAGEKARASGWFARGERLLNSDCEPDCAERGLFLVPEALGVLAQGHPAQAIKLFKQAISIGEQFGDIDLVAIGRLGHGQAMVRRGEVATGLKLLDETMIAISTEAVSPVATGIAYCAVIETCRKVWDLSRAQEWTSALMRWCDSQPDMVPFRGQCLVRRAEIMQFYGEWHRALEETSNACDLLTRPPGEPAAGEAFYRKGELLRLLGHFEQAEECYREAGKWGRKPQPGLALLRLAQGQNDAAATAVTNTLLETNDTIKRAELLPAAVNIMIAVNRTDEARVAVHELLKIASEFDALYLSAISSQCRGAVLLEMGNMYHALECLQKALELWHTQDLPYEAARTRELKGRAYRELNDTDNADTELAAAKWIFEQLGAAPDLERINQSLKKKRHHETHGLTLRELQVLRRVTSGKTNRSIAGELFISERTVDRHVSNIFNKLGVSSRVEATALALKNKILDD